MTCIVAVVKNGRVYMGADSCASSGESWMVSQHPKLFMIDNRMLIGGAGSFRLIDLLCHSFKLPKHPSTTGDDTFMRVQFVKAYKALLKDADLEADLTTCLVGYHGNIYEVQSDLSILNPPEWGHAVGSGASAARASLWTTKDSSDPSERVTTALMAAEAVVPSVRGPFLKMGL